MQPSPMSPLGPIGVPSSQPALAASSKRLVPWLIAVAFFMESLDTTILNTAVPTIAAALHVAPLSMKSVLASYTLSLAVFIPISGWMADRFGTRRVFASAIGIFTLGSFLCGISSNLHVLVACRILQGCGGSMMVPVGRLTVVRTFAKSELVRAMSFVAIPGLIGPMLGPIAGGLIVGYFHWRLIFFVNVPIGLAGLFMVYLHLPDYREHTHPLDVAGLILFGSGVALLSYVLEVFGEHTLSIREILGLLAVSILLLAGYAFHATKTAYPMLNLILFRLRTFRAAVSGSFLTRLGIGGIPFLFPLLYQVGLGFTPIQSGLLMMPQAIAAMSLKVTMPRILARFGYRAVLVFQHTDHRPVYLAFRYHREGYAGVAGSGRGVLLRVLHVAAIYEHEHSCLCRGDGGRGEQRELHREHGATDGYQFRRRFGVAGDGLLYSRALSVESHAIHSRHPSGVLCARRDDPALHDRFPRIEKRRRGCGEPEGVTRRIVYEALQEPRSSGVGGLRLSGTSPTCTPQGRSIIWCPSLSPHPHHNPSGYDRSILLRLLRPTPRR
jgi:MFS family permease